MSDQAWLVVQAILGTIGVVLSGAGAKRLINHWLARERDRLKLAEATTKDRLVAAGEKRRLLAADNEQRASMLHEMVDERDIELKEIRARELLREREMSDVRSQLARLEERSTSQALQIAALQAEVARWNHDYEDMKAERDSMKAERDEYRQQKHDADNKLTPAVLKASVLERDLAARDAEIARMRGQLSAHLEHTTKDPSS